MELLDRISDEPRRNDKDPVGRLNRALLHRQVLAVRLLGLGRQTLPMRKTETMDHLKRAGPAQIKDDSSFPQSASRSMRNQGCLRSATMKDDRR